MPSDASERAKKSSRALADWYELGVLKAVTDHASTPDNVLEFEYEDDVKHAEERVAIARGDSAASLLAAQQANLDRATPHITRLIDDRVAQIGPVVEASWVGRTVGLDVPVTDVAFRHSHGWTDFSLKSTQYGEGTYRNIGGASIKKLLDVDLRWVNTWAYEEVLEGWREAVTSSRFDELQLLKLSERRHGIDEKEREVARAVGSAIRDLATTEILYAFNALPQQRCKAVAAAALCVAEVPNPNLFVVSANLAGVTVRRGLDKVPQGQLRAERTPDSSSGIAVFCDDACLFKLQVNCTNGLGLSALCVRTFGPGKK
jgi:hypothetical protein